ncbi:MAG: glycosyltransferase, partial [Pirellulales bacterium]
MGPGGTERSAQNCAIAFHEHGHEVAVLAYQGGGVRAETLQAAGIPVFVGGTTEQELHEATNHACAWRPEIIHLHTTGRQTPVESAILRHVKVAMSRRIPVIATKHFAWADRSNDRGLVDVHMQLSRWCMWKWRQWSRGLQPQPLGAVVPHMIQHDAFYPASAAVAAEFRAEHAIPSDAFVFGRVGQPIAAKWSQVCFQAFASIASSDPRIWFLVVGAPEEYRRII